MPGSTEDHWGRQDAAQAIALVSSLPPSLCLLQYTSLVFSCGFARADGVYGCQDHIACGDSKQISYTRKFAALPNANSQMSCV
jgi:hypothetical protein